MDIMKPDQRRKAMVSNRGRTRPELSLASALWKRGLRYFTYEGYRIRVGRKLVGKPDLIFSNKRVVIFVDGCFWHGCPKCDRVPSTMSSFWLTKIQANITRDRHVTEILEKEGWKVIRVPEHCIRTGVDLEETANHLTNYLKQPTTNLRNFGQGK